MTDKVKDIKYKIRQMYKGITLDKEKHIYMCDGEVLKAVTRYTDQFKPAFNTEFAAKGKAESWNRANPGKPKRTAEWYKRYWKANNKEIRERGHRVHSYAEFYPDFPEPRCNKERAIGVWFDLLENKYEVVAQEQKVFSKKYKLAGTIDLLLINKETGKLVIVDWKSNETHVQRVYKNKKLKKPFTDKENCSLNSYCIQLSTYQTILEDNGFEVEDLWVVWLKKDRSFTPDERYTLVDFANTSEHELYIQYSIASVKDKLIENLTEIKVDMKETFLKAARGKKRKSSSYATKLRKLAGKDRNSLKKKNK